jgi:hypothetical protein
MEEGGVCVCGGGGEGEAGRGIVQTSASSAACEVHTCPSKQCILSSRRTGSIHFLS